MGARALGRIHGQTQILEGKLVRVLSWYDNEWGFATRMSDTAAVMGKLI